MKINNISLVLLFVISIGCKQKTPTKPINLKEVENRGVEVVNLLPASPKNNADIVLETKAIHIDDDGREHVRFKRKYRGLDIIGGDLITHKDKVSGLSSSDEANPKNFNLESKPSINQAYAEKIAREKFKGSLKQLRNLGLVIFAHDPAKEPKLAWDILIRGTVKSLHPSETHFFIDANTAEILGSWDDIQTAVGTGNGIQNGVVALETSQNPTTLLYSLQDPLRGNLHTVDDLNQAIFTSSVNVFGNGLSSDRASAAADAQFGAATTWDYFNKAHGRLGIRNDGIGSKSIVHYGVNYANAFWQDSCLCMTYGDGDGNTIKPLVSLDVVGHEMSHGITSATAGLIYAGESGGLNEATSDIFGSMVEFYANSAADAPDYLIGEKIFTNGSFIRSMNNPNADGLSPNCYSSTLGTLDVHYSSGVANHFFYLLAEGTSPASQLPASTTCNSSALTGIGRDAAAKIWYRALTLYMVSNTNYAGARTATLRAAEDLYGIGSSEANAVANAWAGVSVGSQANPSSNRAPTALSLSANIISENLPIGSLVGSLSTQDPNPGDVFTYSLQGADALAFRLVGNAVQSNVIFNFESKNSYLITIVSTDSGGLSISVPLTINIRDVNEAPTNVSLSASSVLENVPVGTNVGKFTTTDPDLGQSFSYSISGADAAAFLVLGDQLTTAVLFNRAVKSSFSITVTSQDSSQSVFSKVMTITIAAVPVATNQAPTAVNISATAISENQAAGTTIGALSTTDSNLGDSFTYALSGLDATSFRIVGNALQSNAVFNFEAKASYSISIRSTDAGGLSVLRAMTIMILNVNEPPSNITLSPSSISQVSPIGTTVGSLTSTDPDAGQTFTYSISGADSAAFRIVGNQLVSAVIFNRRVKSRYTITVVTKDSAGASFSKSIAVSIR